MSFRIISLHFSVCLPLFLCPLTSIVHVLFITSSFIFLATCPNLLSRASLICVHLFWRRMPLSYLFCPDLLNPLYSHHPSMFFLASFAHSPSQCPVLTAIHQNMSDVGRHVYFEYMGHILVTWYFRHFSRLSAIQLPLDISLLLRGREQLLWSSARRRWNYVVLARERRKNKNALPYHIMHSRSN